MSENERHACYECGSTDDVLPVSPVWTAYGQNSFDFAWHCASNPRYLCKACEDEFGSICNDCGGIVEGYYYGMNYLPEDYSGDHLCPDCAEKHGFECCVRITRSDKRENTTND